MRLIPAVTLLASLFSISQAASIASRTDVCLTEIPCDDSMDYQSSSSTSQLDRRMTNGERLSRRLKLNPPRRRVDGTPSQPSAVPMTTARIRVDRADGTGSLGYVGQPDGNTFTKAFIGDAAIVTFPTASGLAGSNVNLMLQSPTGAGNFPYLGLVQGRDNTNSNLAPESFHYVYISSTAMTPVGSPPSNVGNGYTARTGQLRTSESAVFTINSTAMRLSATWVNEDGTTPAIKIFSQNGALYAGGDATAFTARYPAPIIELALFVEVVV